MSRNSYRSYEEHSFYCINCGKKSIPCIRQKSLTRERFHRKKLYCPTCKLVINAVECRDDNDVSQFLEDFNKGLYQEEARAEVEYEKQHRELF